MGWLLVLGKLDRHLSRVFRSGKVMTHFEKSLTVSSILCSDFAIKRIDEPFITRDDRPEEWAL